MITKISQWNFQRKRKKHLRNKMKITFMKIWDLEFLLEKLRSMKEGFRREHDRINEKIDAAKRRLYDEKYVFYYAETGDIVPVANLTLTYEDIEKLPNEKIKDIRFYKISKLNPDTSVVEGMESLIKRFEPDVEQLKKQIDDIDSQIEGQGGVVESIEGFRTVNDLLKEYIKRV